MFMEETGNYCPFLVSTALSTLNRLYSNTSIIKQYNILENGCRLS